MSGGKRIIVVLDRKPELFIHGYQQLANLVGFELQDRIMASIPLRDLDRISGDLYYELSAKRLSGTTTK